MTSDRDLLRRYAREGDEAAFAEVARRQADLVYSIALRTTRDGQLAEDVAQAVFIKLASRAGFLCHYDTVVGWLHTTTRHCAIDAIRAEARRRAREQEATRMHHITPVPEANWESIGPLLDEAVGSLGEDDRKAVLLRYFKNLSHQEIGEELGLSENSANKRVERALEKLRDYFACRGVTASSTLLAAAISANSVRAAPPHLIEKIAPASLAVTGGTAPMLFLKIFLMSAKAKLVLIAAIVLMGVVAFIGLTRSSRSTELVASVKTAIVNTPPRPLGLVARGGAAPVKSVAAVIATPAQVQPATAVESQPKPQADLNECIAQTIQLLKANDMLNFVKTVISPSGIKAAIASGSEDDLAALYGGRYPQMMEQLQAALESVKDESPVMNADGTRAEFKLGPSMKGYVGLGESNGKIVFFKADGYWYLR